MQADELLDVWDTEKGDEATVERMVEALSKMKQMKMVQRIKKECYVKN